MSVRGREPRAGDLDWASTVLTPAEMTLFRSMSPTDQAHSLEVARLVQAALDEQDVDEQGVDESGPGDHGQSRYGVAGGDCDWVLAAGLMHDIGKVEASAGVVLRVLSTLGGGLIGDRAALQLSGLRGPLGTVGLHIRYPVLGASLLGAIGSHEFVRAWAAEHHRAPVEWSVPRDMGVVLRDADNAAC